MLAIFAQKLTEPLAKFISLSTRRKEGSLLKTGESIPGVLFGIHKVRVVPQGELESV